MREHERDGAHAEHPAIIDIVLRTRLQDIPDPEPCAVCGQPMVKAYLEHISTGAHLSVRAARTAGYRCPNPDCGVVTYSAEAFAESLAKASRVLRSQGDVATAAVFERRVELEQRHTPSHRAEKAPVAHVR